MEGGGDVADAAAHAAELGVPQTIGPRLTVHNSGP